MKKFFVLAIVVLAISLAFTACKTDEHGNTVQSKGGHVNLKNDTSETKSFSIYFGGEKQTVDNGKTQLLPGDDVVAYSETDTSYAVYAATYNIDSLLMDYGQLTGGKTVNIIFSNFPDF